jgi:hypothetical protein
MDEITIKLIAALTERVAVLEEEFAARRREVSEAQPHHPAPCPWELWPDETRVRSKLAAKILGFEDNTMRKRRVAGLPPAFEKPSKTVVTYRLGTLREFQRTIGRRSTSDDGSGNAV